MNTEREGKVAGLKRQIEHGDYRVDPRAVADALLRRFDDRRLQSGAWGLDPYSTCSYPDSAPSESAKPTIPGP